MNETLPWTDIDATTAPTMTIRKPINIKRTTFNTPRHLRADDSMVVTLKQCDENGVEVSKDVTPPLIVDREITVDSITKFEVVDEFGVDVGIGFVLGQAK